jgi:phenylalanyl-tRNA synthetase alpha chain
MQKPKDVVSHLHPLEIQVLRSFQAAPQPFASEILTLTMLQEPQIRMALEWLQQKDLLTVLAEQAETSVSLTKLGQELHTKRIMELRILTKLSQGRDKRIPEIAAALQEDKKETNIAVANLKKAGIVEIQAGGVVVPIEGADISELQLRQELLQRVSEAGTCSKNDFTAGEWSQIEGGSRKRGKSKGLFRISDTVDKQFVLTETGQAVLALVLERGMTGEEISQLTPQMLKDGSWKTGTFRAYNVEGAFPRIVAGKKNPYRQFLDFAKRKLIALGFEEMRGSLVESEFWNMDALYMPQFHPARAIHDAYYVKEPTHCKELLEPNASNVAAMHSSGGESDSKGWQYQFDKERTKRLVLRSQGTALSARQLANAPKIPGKYFAIARCFRYDAVDSTHAPDFFQVEGIVLGEEINFRHLLGLLKLFALEVARSKEVRFAPDYFPFTEPSVEVSMKHPVLGWVELGGAGIFRPEVTKPHGIAVPVIAWGLGLDRMAMVALDIHDIRDLFSVDLELIRSKRVKPII